MAKLHYFLLFTIFAFRNCFFPRTCDGKVLMEYIGASGDPIQIDDIPIKEGIDFYFILGFAIDADLRGNIQNGTFSAYWTSTLTPEIVQSVKDRHPNVKFMASLAGWSIGDKVIKWYAPNDTRVWITNAFDSLKALVETYHLDGIDVDYENFPAKNVSSFAYCIGEVLSLLKNRSVISVATIAPFYSTVEPYIELFRRYGDVIDYVNYQFYTDKVISPRAYLADFKNRTTEFDEAKVLPSYEVNGRGIQGDAFFEALDLLEKSGFNITGVMIFSADASVANDFYYERNAQAFLLNLTILNSTTTTFSLS